MALSVTIYISHRVREQEGMLEVQALKVKELLAQLGEVEGQGQEVGEVSHLCLWFPPEFVLLYRRRYLLPAQESRWKKHSS